MSKKVKVKEKRMFSLHFHFSIHALLFFQRMSATATAENATTIEGIKL